MSETLFQLANLYILPFWLLMIFLPHWSWTKRIIGSIWFIAPLALAYSVLIIPMMLGGGDASGGGSLAADLMNPTTAGLAKLLGTQAGVAVGWIHFLAFDLFVGRWAYLDSREKNISAWLVSPCIFFILMLGPLGFLLYLLLRTVVGRKA